MNVRIESSWKEILQAEFSKPYFLELVEFVKSEYTHHKVYPSGKDIFLAFELTPFDKVKVVLLGQDPYHGAGQAHGLCFSVKKGVKLPPSLRNIYKELQDDLQIPVPNHGDLTAWAQQGVLLLNATLTVRAESPGSHQNKGWEQFTDAVIHTLAERKQNLVFIMWGAYAQRKGALIDKTKHLVIEAAHPSPFSADRGFFGHKPFSRCNGYLALKGIEPIRWQL